MAELLRAVKNGLSILATQSETQPVLALQEPEQYLKVQTSGSSGAPKTIKRSPESWIASFEVNKAHFGLSSTDVYATFGSLKHSLSLYACLEAFHVGADLCNLSKIGPRAQALALQRLHATILYATPTQLRVLLKTTDITFEAVRLVLCGGGKLEPALKAKLHARCPNAMIREFFGASETSFVTLSDEDTPNGSVGRVYPNVEIKISNQDTDGVGEIWVKSPYLFESYVGDEFQDVSWKGKFVSLGEMGRFDKYGNLFLAGRASRMVTISDINVFPERIEQTLVANSEVESCAVVAVSDAMRGTKLICFFEGDENLSENLIQLCRRILKPHEVPRKIIACHRLPLLPAGKPDLQKLQNRAMKL